MCFIRELIEELKVIIICSRFKFLEGEFKDISEIVESLYLLMCEYLKNFFSEEILSENWNYYLGFIVVFVIIVCIIVVIGLIVVFFGKWFGFLLFIFLVLVLFFVIKFFVN